MGEPREKHEAFVTLATNDTYALGCLVLGRSLRRVGTTRQLAVMITQGVSPSVRNQLSGVFDHTFVVNVLDSNDAANLQLLGRPDLSVTFTKFHCWRLTQFKKCVFMDADTLVVQNIDELFDREELSAAPDPGWPDCFNSGVFVYVPSEETYRNLLVYAVTSQSFDGGDQGLLNLFYKGWATEDIGKHLPFIYNVVSQAFYSYLPAFKQFRDTIKVVHFIGAVKPWHHTYSSATRTVRELPNTGHSHDFLQLWWDIFMEDVQPNIDPQLPPSEEVSGDGGIVGELANIHLEGGNAVDKDDRVRKLQWEQGHADYMGVDRFENIKARLDEKIAEPTPSGSRASVNKEEEPKDEPQPEVSSSAAGTVHATDTSSDGVDMLSVVASVSPEVVDSPQGSLTPPGLGAGVSAADSAVGKSAIKEAVADTEAASVVSEPSSCSVEETSVFVSLPTLITADVSLSLPVTAQPLPGLEPEDTVDTSAVSVTLPSSSQSEVVEAAGASTPVEKLAEAAVTSLSTTTTTTAAGKPGAASVAATSKTFGKPAVTSVTATSTTVGKLAATSVTSTSKTFGKQAVTSTSPSPFATSKAAGKPAVTSTSPSSAATSTAVGKPAVTPPPSPAAASTAVGEPAVTPPSPSPAATSTAVDKTDVTSSSPSPTSLSAVGKPGVTSVTTTAKTVGKLTMTTSSPSPATTSKTVGKLTVTTSSPSPATTSATVGKPAVTSSPSPVTTSPTASKPAVTSSPSPATTFTTVASPSSTSSSTASQSAILQTAQPASVTDSKTESKVSESTVTKTSQSPEPNQVAATDQPLPSTSTSARPESLTTKPAPRSAADPSKSSFVSSLASKFAKPSPTSPVAAAPKVASPLSRLASKFDTPGTEKSQSFGTSTRSPVAVASQKPTAASASQSKASEQAPQDSSAK